MYQQSERVTPRPAAPPIAGDEIIDSESARLERALETARRRLLEQQNADGHWCAELEGDTILESEYVLCLYFLGRQGEERVEKAANYVRRAQLSSGGWPNYPGGPADVSASIKAYLVLKLAGDEEQAPHMIKARQKILSLGGLDAANSFTKIYLSVFGLYEWSLCPAVPPEIILFPRWFYFNVYAMSSWSRAIVVPLAILWAHKPSCPLPTGLDELRAAPAPAPAADADASFKRRAWVVFFRAVDRGFKLLETLRIKPFRRLSLKRCERWALERVADSDGLGAIFPPIVNLLIALRCLGYPLDHPVVRGQMAELEKLEIEDRDSLRLQPCKSPVWDTALALNALYEAGLDGASEPARAAGRWLLEREVRRPGDCQIMNPELPVGGWYFEYRNEFYPDCDDTIEVTKALSGVRFAEAAEDERRRAALQRGRAWLEGMQNRDGGWAAFDRGCDREVLTYVPFADHNAMIDPSTVDITSRCLEGLDGLDPAARRRAAEFVRREQEPDGPWYGRWGCNYLYGTWLALRGLSALGEACDVPAIERAADWLRGCQNLDGGWGELPASYDDPALKGIGPSTAAQTAWALMGLFAAGDFSSPAVRRGVGHLLDTQRPEGDWQDRHWTGTGFPRVFYLRYHLYATYFPLQALAEYRTHLRAAGGELE